MCSLSDFISALIASLILNFLHFGVVVVGASGSSAAESGLPSLHIDITRKPSVHLNGIEIDANSLFDHLEDHERELLFGKSNPRSRTVKLVHLSHLTIADEAAVATPRLGATTQAPKRVKRSDVPDATGSAAEAATRPSGAQPSQEVSVQIKDNEHSVLLKLRQTPKLIDDAFIFIRRYANSTQFIEDSHKLAERYERCFYRNEDSALDLCDDENVRGVFHHNSTSFVIHPLPSRFGNSTHVILEADKQNDIFLSSSQIDSNIQFEPDHEELNELNVIHFPSSEVEETSRPTRNTNFSNYEVKDNLKSSQQIHQYHRNHHSSTSNRIPLNLRYKPRHHHNEHHKHHQRNPHHQPRHRRHISGSQWKIPQVLHIETAIFVDSDLFKHMAKNFPKNTESHLIRFVLAMINGVQLLYHHPTLGHRVNFVLKRLEILFKDPSDLRRSSDIDTYLSNFCMWQKSQNPASDANTMHYDHAVILTGLDLYVVAKNGKVISQVVGLAPVAGMCTPTSSCTINEGKHFESVFVVAHEIGHNLGMRHDTNENSCDSSLYIMSPTLGSGKTTWSKCSRTYLNAFLENSQAECLFDRGQFINNLDHSAEGMLPGERFDANQQCMLKYGRDSVRAESQEIADICRDLHCQRERYTWTSHPALEGTKCGESMSPSWGAWGEAGDCDSGCLYGPSRSLREGSTGLKIYSRSCAEYGRRCAGRNRKYESCLAKQCYHIPVTTIEDFATQVCEKAQKFDAELTGVGQQVVGNIEESCKVICKTKSNGTKSRSWTFPDGTTCHSNLFSSGDIAYCIAGRCEKFSCDNNTHNYFKIDPKLCQYRQPPEPAETDNRRANTHKNNFHTFSRYADGGRRNNKNHDVGLYGPTTARSKYENEVAVRSFHGQPHNHPYKRKTDPYQHWNKYNYHLNDKQITQRPPSAPPPPVSASLVSLAPTESEWIIKSGCHSSCVVKSKGVQVVTSRRTGVHNIQLCSHTVQPCERLQTPTEFAENTCARYKLKVRGLSGHGTQIAASIDEPDRSCRVGCQDEFKKYRYYLVNGKNGHFPLGTKCSHKEERYCINGKCLEFGSDNIPLQQSHVSLALFRNRRSLEDMNARDLQRVKRSYLYYEPVNITETITQEFINEIVNSIINSEQEPVVDEFITDDHIEFTNPIHISTDEVHGH